MKLTFFLLIRSCILVMYIRDLGLTQTEYLLTTSATVEFWDATDSPRDRRRVCIFVYIVEADFALISL